MICRTFRKHCTDLLMTGFSAFKGGFSIIIIFSSLIDNERWRWNTGQLNKNWTQTSWSVGLGCMLVVLYCYSYNKAVRSPEHNIKLSPLHHSSLASAGRKENNWCILINRPTQHYVGSQQYFYPQRKINHLENIITSS